jgi:hypothetical protein
MMQKMGSCICEQVVFFGMIWHIPQALSEAGGVHTLLICAISCIIHAI